MLIKEKQHTVDRFSLFQSVDRKIHGLTPRRLPLLLSCHLIPELHLHDEHVTSFVNHFSVIMCVSHLGLTLEFLSTKIPEIFMWKEFRISRKNYHCFAKFRVLRNWLYHAKHCFECFAFYETKHLTSETKRNWNIERKNTFPLRHLRTKFSSLISWITLLCRYLLGIFMM